MTQETGMELGTDQTDRRRTLSDINGDGSGTMEPGVSSYDETATPTGTAADKHTGLENAGGKVVKGNRQSGGR